MICNICGGTETFSQGGIEYCKECNSQFSESREEESGDDSLSNKSLLSSPKSVKGKKISKLTKKYFAPWISIEAYNVIIAKQVSALIKLGCSENLKSVVLYIWSQYLQKLQFAFMKNCEEEISIPHLSVYALKRDKQLLYSDGSIDKKHNSSSKPVDVDKKIIGTKDWQRKKFTKEAMKHIKAEDIYSTDDITNSSESSCDDNLIKMEDLESDVDSISTELPEPNPNIEERKKILANKMKKLSGAKKVDFRRKETCFDHMTLRKTLSFCHLGLLYTEDKMSSCDFIRLTNEGKIPYIDVTRHFPPYMQLQADDRFDKHETPDVKAVSLMSAKIFEFLKLPKFKHPPLLPIATCFIKDLNLPNDLIPVVKVLIHKFETSRGEWYTTKKRGIQYQPIPLYEIQAVSIIVIALKLLLVLDDEFEIEHGEVMKKLNAVNTDSEFFIWKEWQQQAFLKEYLFLKSDFSNGVLNRIDSLSADRIISDYPYSCLNPDLFQQANEETKNELSIRTTFKTLLESVITCNTLKSWATSFPLQCQVHSLMADWEKLPMFQETKDINFNFISKDFSSHKLCYKPDSGSLSSECVIDILLESLYESNDPFSDRNHKKYIKTSKKYWHINHIYKNLASDLEHKWLEELPSSFKWLLKFLCKYIQISCIDLYMEIKHIEQILFKSIG